MRTRPGVLALAVLLLAVPVLTAGCNPADPGGGSSTASGSAAARGSSGQAAPAPVIVADAPATVAPGSHTTIAVSFGGSTTAKGPIAVALDGPGAVSATSIDPVPGQVVFTAAPAPGVRATITLTAVGASPKTLVITTTASAAPAGAYRITGDNQDVTLEGTACDLAKPFTLKFTRGMVGTMDFTPSSDRAGKFTYSGRLTNAPMTASGSGTYTIALAGSGTTGTLTYTQSGQVHGGGASTSTWQLAMTAAPACAG